MLNRIMVSIECNSYNHEKFIAEALDSMLMQKTDFAYEILVHDDASTDRTADIIRTYEQKYPDIIKPIYQTINQYSQDIPFEVYNSERGLGKYIAVCEGDDYWTDPEKLQKQVDYMEAHPECSMCVHAAEKVSAITKKRVDTVRPSRRDKIFSVEEVIEGGGELFATNSIMYSRKKIPGMPEFYLNATIGDYPMVILGALSGTIFYMERNMAAYRVEVEGSWTDVYLSDISAKKKHLQDIANLLDEVNAYTNFKYDNVISRTKKRNRFYLLLKQLKIKETMKKGYRQFYVKPEFFKRIFKRITI
ncbi:glycosyl transferase family protein [Planococcus sp. PAMC 21323]|uniref:glycosyltransferase family 2 protein n=1 Tax=Planococcus sp. PAMC 21323 TaxID=1526927 RepID=UPI00056E8C4A|nr:glycosyltransferase family 2 protein [Planococcus sp. PAMC 21323]AIY06235.1 glycosyl transferase family protein [Planococcus sp. PAMC 21323]